MLQFEIEPRGPVSNAFLARGLDTFGKAADHVRALPYARNANRTDRLLVLSEGRGTCSGKNALLAELAAEHGQPLELVLGIFKMTAKSNPPVRAVLQEYGLPYLPELHTYLSFGGERLDFTGPGNPVRPVREFLAEKKITPPEVETFKTEYHREYLQKWLAEEGLDDRFDVETVWQVREECIAARSAPPAA